MPFEKSKGSALAALLALLILIGSIGISSSSTLRQQQQNSFTGITSAYAQQKEAGEETAEVNNTTISSNNMMTSTNDGNVSVVTTKEDPDVKFASNIEMIKGHMDQAVIDKDKNDTGLAKAHSEHPVAELYTLIGPEIQKHDSTLNSTLETALTDLPNKVDTLSASNFRTETEKIAKMLDQAYTEVVPATERNNSEFNAKVIISLVSHVAEEYGEGVKDGKIIATVEYQDAQGFRGRADGLFNQTVKDAFTTTNNNNSTLLQIKDDNATTVSLLSSYFIDLKSRMNSLQDASIIQNQTNKIIAELCKEFGIQEQTQSGADGQDSSSSGGSSSNDNNNNNSTTTTTSIIQNIQTTKQLLKQASVEYRKGNTPGADNLVTSAYLDNFEQVEPVLVQHNAIDLKQQIEQMIRVQLREMIKDNATADAIDSQINAINAKLDQAATVLETT